DPKLSTAAVGGTGSSVPSSCPSSSASHLAAVGMQSSTRPSSRSTSTMWWADGKVVDPPEDWNGWKNSMRTQPSASHVDGQGNSLNGGSSVLGSSGTGTWTTGNGPDGLARSTAATSSRSAHGGRNSMGRQWRTGAVGCQA